MNNNSCTGQNKCQKHAIPAGFHSMATHDEREPVGFVLARLSSQIGAEISVSADLIWCEHFPEEVQSVVPPDKRPMEQFKVWPYAARCSTSTL